MEHLAIFHGLRIAWDLGIRHVVCFSDSMLAISLVRDPPSQFHVFAVLVNNICALLRRDWEVRVEHILREGNSCADFLAKAGAMQDQSFYMVHHPLPGMESLLLADSMGTVVIR
ncbi:uncharacterized protein LOC130722649 [Lotus japonicus]|uniref:uncharacterized protein LOC130722649 n=1 Tax=Lotus japonicus TaxID=34305 RepID=UPI00258EBD17|nr:uncharacterized protein LOC130722649 [Lotus japonicus]